jgi:hypothetical protein
MPASASQNVEASSQSLQASVASSTVLPDSIYMNILRHGSLSVGYFSYFTNSSSTVGSLGLNTEQLRNLDKFFRVILADTLIRFDKTVLTGSSSIEGSTARNEQLSHERARSLRDFLDNRYHITAHMPIDLQWVAEDWEGMERSVAATSPARFAGRDKVLRILRDATLTDDYREALLRTMDGGAVYRYLRAYIFPQQRRANINMICNLTERFGQHTDSLLAYNLLPHDEAERFLRDTTVQSMPVALPSLDNLLNHHALDSLLTQVHRIDTVRVYIRDTVSVVARDTLTRIVYDTVTVDREVAPTVVHTLPFTFALKTNLLYDVALLPNLAVEVAFPRRWSAAVDVAYAWWNRNSGKHYCYRLFTVGGEARKWLGNKQKPTLQGHYLGLYARTGIYDFRFWWSKGYQSRNLFYSAGISYGYSARLSKRLNMEFGLSAGYIGGKYKKYHYDPANDRYPWDGTYRLNYFGLTDAKIGLVYKFGKN